MIDIGLKAREEYILKKIIAVLVFPLVAAAAVNASWQDSTKPGGSQSAATQVPLKVQLVVSRYAGEKKIGSVPYILSVVANDNDKTSLRMGVDVPVPQSVLGPAKAGDNASVPVTSYSYRSVGTNIDCAARTVDGVWFKLDLGVSDTSVFLPDKQATPSGLTGIPAFRSFTSTFNVLLKDGQTTQHTSATDSVSGEVLRVDVTLTVLK